MAPARADRFVAGGYRELGMRAAPVAGPALRGPQASARPLRVRQLSVRPTAPPVVADDLLLLGTETGLVALDRSGALRWERSVGMVRESPLWLGPGRYLVTTARGRLWEVDLAGELRALPARFVASAAPRVLPTGVIAFATDAAEVQLVDRSGAALDRIPTGLPGALQLQLWGDGGLAVVGADGALALIGAGAGLVRRVAHPEPLTGAPLRGHGGEVWLLGQEGGVARLLPDGQIRAAANLAPEIPETAVVGRDAALRIGLRRSFVVCIEPDGTERFRRSLDGRPGELVLDADDTAYFTTSHGSLYGVDARGQIKFRAQVAAREAPRPALAADGTLYLVTQRGLLQAWK